MESGNPALDEDVISSMVGDLISLNAQELIPLIKSLYEKELVFRGIVGDYQSVEKDIKTQNISTNELFLPRLLTVMKMP